MLTPVLELSDCSLSGARALERIQALDVFGAPDHRNTFARCYHKFGMEILPDCSDQFIAYIFLYVRKRDVGQYGGGPFDSFPGSVAFHGLTIEYRRRDRVESLMKSHPEVFRPYEINQTVVRYILVVDPSERRVGFFFHESGDLDHILLN